MQDSEAWRRKFVKLHEQNVLRAALQNPKNSIEVYEEVPEQSPIPPKIFELKPIITKTEDGRSHNPKLDDDPYIISQTARTEIEQASSLHKRTLKILKSFLHSIQIRVSESKLIDAYATLSDGPAIFEIKSITESNEREQIRHALSQLYEYRFLHSLFNATLWVVFSREPSSKWYIDCLIADRGMRMAWVENGI